MEELWDYFVNTTMDYVLSVGVIFVVAIGYVWASGRMLGFTKTHRAKNVVGLVVIVVASFFEVWFNLEWEDYSQLAWLVNLHACGGIIAYVALGFRLYDRADNFLDAKFARDDKPADEIKEAVVEAVKEAVETAAPQTKQRGRPKKSS